MGAGGVRRGGRPLVPLVSVPLAPLVPLGGTRVRSTALQLPLLPGRRRALRALHPRVTPDSQLPNGASKCTKLAPNHRNGPPTAKMGVGAGVPPIRDPLTPLTHTCLMHDRCPPYEHYRGEDTRGNKCDGKKYAGKNAHKSLKWGGQRTHTWVPVQLPQWSKGKR